MKHMERSEPANYGYSEREWTELVLRENLREVERREMKERKVVVTLEVSTNLTLKELKRTISYEIDHVDVMNNSYIQVKQIQANLIKEKE